MRAEWQLEECFISTTDLGVHDFDVRSGWRNTEYVPYYPPIRLDGESEEWRYRRHGCFGWLKECQRCRHRMIFVETRE